jgi:hypothetical protein
MDFVCDYYFRGGESEDGGHDRVLKNILAPLAGVD